MKFQVIQAKQQHFEQIEALYERVHDYLGKNGNYPGWKKDVYPAVTDIEEGIKTGTLYLATLDGRIAGSIVLNHECAAAYQEVTWGVEAEKSEFLVIHTLLVDPIFYLSEFAIGTRLMEFAIDFAKEHSMKALRLDVYEENVPAIKLYEKLNFTCVGKADLGYQEFSLNYFKLYEKLL